MEKAELNHLNGRTAINYLNKGFNGIKTGITPAAGPWMATSFCKDNIHLIVIVLDWK